MQVTIDFGKMFSKARRTLSYPPLVIGVPILAVVIIGAVIAVNLLNDKLDRDRVAVVCALYHGALGQIENDRKYIEKQIEYIDNMKRLNPTMTTGGEKIHKSYSDPEHPRMNFNGMRARGPVEYTMDNVMRQYSVELPDRLVKTRDWGYLDKLSLEAMCPGYYK